MITRKQVADERRVNHTAEIFGIHFPMQLEPFVYRITGKLSRGYNGGYWEFFTLSNGGFYMAANSRKIFHVISESGFEGDMSADALGITACLYAYSQLSFSKDQEFAEICAQHYHWLREYMLDLPEARDILGAID